MVNKDVGGRPIYKGAIYKTLTLPYLTLMLDIKQVIMSKMCVSGRHCSASCCEFRLIMAVLSS